MSDQPKTYPSFFNYSGVATLIGYPESSALYVLMPQKEIQ